MIKHENPHIEIINKSLWAVRFSLLPYIPQISYKPDPAIPIELVPGQLSPSGIMVLNKDFKYYEQYKRAYISAMKLKPRQIRKELADLAKFPMNQVLPAAYNFCLTYELERRKIMKGGAS